MTFYNVISGIIFLGACQAFLDSLGTSIMWAAAALGVTILNESVITSELVEGATQLPYKLDLKLLDFVTFATLTWALLVVTPSSNVFNVNVGGSLPGAHSPRAFWALLVAYWVLTLYWNERAGLRNRQTWKLWFFVAMHLMWVPALLAGLITWSDPDLSSAATWPSGLVLAFVSAYMVSKMWAKA